MSENSSILISLESRWEVKTPDAVRFESAADSSEADDAAFSFLEIFFSFFSRLGAIRKNLLTRDNVALRNNLFLNPPAMPEPKRSDEEIMDELMQTPLFMTSLPKDGADNATLEAIQSLVFDGEPNDVATNFKNHGNEAFELKNWKEALHYYSQGIQVSPDDVTLLSILHTNRASVHFHIQNYRQCILDCRHAIQLCPTKIKPYFRAAKAFYALDKIDEAVQTLQSALQIDPTNPALISELGRCESRQKELTEKLLVQQQRLDQRQQEESQLLQLVYSRGIKLHNPTKTEITEMPSFFHPQAGYIRVFLDKSTQTLKWPVMFFYPEYKQSDFISEFDEQDVFGEHLDLMFSGHDVIEWDIRGDYTSDKLDVYFETSNTDKPRLLKMGRGVRLGDVLKHPDFHVVSGAPSFIVLQRGSEFSKEFKLKYKWCLF